MSLWLRLGSLALAMACARPKPDLREGPAEDDPTVPNAPDSRDTARPDPDSGEPDTIDWEDLSATPTDQTVCFPGPEEDHTVCLPTVAWSSTWGAPYDYPDPLDDDPQYRAPVRFFDLYAAALEPTRALAPNFTLGEFLQDYKGRFGIFQPHVVTSLQTLRDWTGGPLYINSAYRNVDYNAGVGGAQWSRHLYGDAVDIRSDTASLSELATLCEDLGAGFTSVYTSHVHCDWRDSPLEPGLFDPVAETSTARAAHPHPTAHVDVMPSGTLRVIPSGFDEGTPRIHWTTRDASGNVLHRGTSSEVQADAAARMLELDVGRVVQVRVAL